MTGEETGFHPYRGNIKPFISALIESGEVSPTGRFLDLGAGDGKIVVDAGSLGLNSYGIEINPNLAQQWEENIRSGREHGKTPDNSRCQVVLGSYYPKEYIFLREQGRTIAPRYEDGLFYRSYGSETVCCDLGDERDRVFHPVSSDQDPFKALGFHIEDVDLFFNYSWGIELPSVLEMFSIFGRRDSVLLNNSAGYPVEHKKMLVEMGLVMEPILFKGRQLTSTFWENSDSVWRYRKRL